MAIRTLTGVLVLAMLAVAAAQPCIECSKCDTNNCRKVCKRECPSRDDVSETVHLDRCRRAGRDAGRKVARESCDLTATFCKGGARMFAARSESRVTLKQCGNIAFGECQKYAKDRNRSPCGQNFNGVDECSAQEFKDFYSGEVDERCNREADRIEREGPGRG